MAVIEPLLGPQCGALSRGQALAAGFTDDAIEAQLAGRRWQRAHPGVFIAFTGPLPDLTKLWAALLWAGDGAALCDVTALDRYGVQGLPAESDVHITVDHTRKVVRPPGIVLHRRRRLETFVHPVRAPRMVRLEDAALHRAARLAGLNRLSDGLGLLADVCQQRHTSPSRLRDALAALPKLKSRKAFWAVLDDIAIGAQSFLEISYLRNVERAHGLPAPRRQAGGISLGRRVWRDGEYDEWGVIHELDGRLGHAAADDAASDRRRDLVSAGQGRVTARHGYDDVVDRACETAALMTRVLQVRGWAGAPVECRPACALTSTLHRLRQDAASLAS